MNKDQQFMSPEDTFRIDEGIDADKLDRFREFRRREADRPFRSPKPEEGSHHLRRTILAWAGGLAIATGFVAFTAHESGNGEPASTTVPANTPAQILHANEHPTTAIANERLGLGESSQPAPIVGPNQAP